MNAQTCVVRGGHWRVYAACQGSASYEAAAFNPSVLTLDGIIVHDIVEGSITAAKFIRFVREMVVSATAFPLSSLVHIMFV